MDPTLFPPERKGAAPEEEALRQSTIKESQRKLSEDKALGTIFSRQEYSVIEGRNLSLSGDFYLYINAPDLFFDGAEIVFKNSFNGVKRADPQDEGRVIRSIQEEKEKANTGFGSIFG